MCDYRFLTCCSIDIFSFSNKFILLLLPLGVYWCVYVYTLKLALSLLHPGPFQLNAVAPNVLMAYYVYDFYGLYDI